VRTHSNLKLEQRLEMYEPVYSHGEQDSD
jgi:hypothetical protein